MIVNVEGDFHISRNAMKLAQSYAYLKRRNLRSQGYEASTAQFLPPLELVRVVSKVGLGLGDEEKV